MLACVHPPPPRSFPGEEADVHWLVNVHTNSVACCSYKDPSEEQFHIYSVVCNLTHDLYPGMTIMSSCSPRACMKVTTVDHDTMKI